MSGQGVTRLVVICADATDAVGGGLDVQRFARTFDLPEEIAKYIQDSAGPYRTITFAIDYQEPKS